MDDPVLAWRTPGGRWIFGPAGETEFEPETGKAVSVADLSWRVILRPPDDPDAGRVLRPGDCRVAADPRGDSIVWHAAESSLGVAIEWRLARCGGGIEASLQVLSHGEIPVWAIEFPRVRFRCGDPSWYATIPYSSGYRLPPGRLHIGEEIVLNYPVHASMAWSSVCGGDRSVYLGVHDREIWLKRFFFRRRDDDLEIAVQWPDLEIPDDACWETPPTTIVPDDGDWTAGAARYREWALSWMRPARAPDWFFEHPVWAWVGMKGQHAANPDRLYRDLPGFAARLREAGIPVPQAAGWIEHGHDTHYPDYRAGDSLGGEEALREAVDRIHADGGRITLYTNGRLLDPEGSVGGMEGWRDFCVRLAPCTERDVMRISGTFRDPAPWDPEGVLAKEKYANVTFGVGCPGAVGWRKLLADRLADVMERYGIDGLYVDQVSGCSSLPCYHPGHDHARPGLAWRGYLTLFSALRTRLRGSRPGTWLATEGVCDLFGQIFDVQQAHNDWQHQVLDRADEMPELLRTTLPELLVMMGPIAPGEEKYVRLGHVYGTGLDCFPVLPGRDDDAFLELLHGYARLRRASLRPLSEGVPAPGIETDPAEVRAFGFRTGTELCVHGAWDGEPAGAAEILLPADADWGDAIGEDLAGDPVRTERGRRGGRPVVRVAGARRGLFRLRLLARG